MNVLIPLWIVILAASGSAWHGNFVSPVAQQGSWICIYSACGSEQGGIYLGGAVLVLGDNVTIEDSTFEGGVTGVAAYHVKNLTIRRSTFKNQSAWGILLVDVDHAEIVSNTIENAVRSCPEDPHGCEAAGIMLIGSPNAHIADNKISYSGDCLYSNGRGLPSNNALIENNVCVVGWHNAFEWTYAHGLNFRNNIARGDGQVGCDYAFWLGGSQAQLYKNEGACNHAWTNALRRFTDSTTEPTEITFARH